MYDEGHRFYKCMNYESVIKINGPASSGVVRQWIIYTGECLMRWSSNKPQLDQHC